MSIAFWKNCPAFGRNCKHIPEVSIEWRFSFFITNFLSNHNYFIKILFSPGIIINPRPIETILQGCGSMPLLCVCNSFACLTSSDSRRYSSALEYSPTDVKTCLKLAQLAATPRLLWSVIDFLVDLKWFLITLFQGRNMVYGLRDQSPKYDWDQGSEEKAQGSEEWDQGSQGFWARFRDQIITRSKNLLSQYFSA